MATIRGEYSRLFWKTELNYGVENGAGTWRRFGLTHSATCPDPEYNYEATYIHGEGRNWKFMPGRAREVFTGGIPDIWVQDGRMLKFLLGQISTSGSTPNYTHAISTAMTIPSFTWQVSERDETGALVLLRQYYGCKVGRATLEAREGDKLVMSLDEIMAKNMRHNQSTPSYKRDTGLSQASVALQTSQPYFFHEGSLSLFGTTFAEVKAFRVEIGNALEPEYYIQTSEQEPVPYEINEGRTAFRASVTINMVDAELYKALMTKGLYSGDYKGFTGILEFRRGQSSVDTLKIQLGPTSPTIADPGCFIRRAGTRVVESPLIPIDIELEVPVVEFEVKDDMSTTDYA